MGLLTGLLTLPLAPVRGTMWIAEVLLEEVERRADADEQLRGELERLQIARELGEIDDDEYETAEEELLARYESRLTESDQREVVD